jgi:hypothetical protein
VRSRSYLYGRVGWGVRQVGVGWDVFFWWVECGNFVRISLFFMALAGQAYVSAVSGCGVVGPLLVYFGIFA